MFDWLDLIDVGNTLAQNPNEAHIRSAITRYYYAIFSAIREYLIYFKHQYQFLSNKNIHQKVWKYLTLSKNSNENEIGEFLGKLRNIRNHADYDKDFEYCEYLPKIQEKTEMTKNSINYLRSNPEMVIRWMN